jgi:hypothetical protein
MCWSRIWNSETNIQTVLHGGFWQQRTFNRSRLSVWVWSFAASKPVWLECPLSPSRARKPTVSFRPKPDILGALADVVDVSMAVSRSGSCVFGLGIQR